MPTATTPIARSKSAALARALNSIPHGYDRYTSGVVAQEKIAALVRKLHERHAIAASPAQRIRRKKLGQANAVLALYCPTGASDGHDTGASASTSASDLTGDKRGAFEAPSKAHWLMLFTSGELGAHEELRSVFDKPRLVWLGYELTRYPYNGRTRCTWKRPEEAMRDIFALLEDRLKRRRWSDVEALLNSAARHPGFHGVRGQSWRLGVSARKGGYMGELPHLHYIRKVAQGDRVPCG